MVTSAKFLTVTCAIGVFLTAAVARTTLWGPTETSLRATIAAEQASQPAVLESPPPEDLPLPEPALSISFRHVGAGSCATANCHGASYSGHGYAPGSEYSRWIQEDPHAQAFATLYNPKSQSIVENLAAGKADQVMLPAHRNKTCLACHATQAPSLHMDNRHTIHDGVSCESCHGAAEKWLEPHKWDAWRNADLWSQQEKANIGFNDTSNLSNRAKTCIECHVGSPGRDVNHDLIAAGHPRLYFELSAYLARLPRHWSREKDKRENSSSLEARLWVIGQVTSSTAAVELLAERATNSRKPWPEFSEYNCFACHQDLDEPTRSEKTNSRLTARIQFPWGTWHAAMLNMANSSLELATPGLQDLHGEMNKMFSDRDKVQQCAMATIAQLNGIARILSDKTFSTSELEAYLRQLTAPEFLAEESSWDANVQRYLAIVALRQAVAEILDQQRRPAADWMSPVGKQLHKLRGLLKFPNEGDGPRYGSPRNFADQWEAIRKSYGEIHQQLEPEST